MPKLGDAGVLTNYKHQLLETPRRRVPDDHYALTFRNLKVHKCSSPRLPSSSSFVLIGDEMANTVDPHYSQILCLWVHLSLPFIYDPRSILTTLSCTFADMCRATKQFESVETQATSWHRTSWCPAFCSWAVNKCPFYSLLGPWFSHFCAFFWWFWCLKWSPSK